MLSLKSGGMIFTYLMLTFWTRTLNNIKFELIMQSSIKEHGAKDIEMVQHYITLCITKCIYFYLLNLPYFISNFLIKQVMICVKFYYQLNTDFTLHFHISLLAMCIHLLYFLSYNHFFKSDFFNFFRIPFLQTTHSCLHNFFL